MGLSYSKNNTPPTRPTTTITTEIGALLWKLNTNPSIDKREFETIERQEVNTSKLRSSLERMSNDGAFTQFNTSNMIRERMPLYVLYKTPKGGEDKAKFDWSFQNIRYFDIYASNDANDKIKEILNLYFSSDISEVVLQYCGDGSLLFSVKTGHDGGMTLSTATLIIEDALKIYSTYSEKSGRSSRVELSKNYDKKLHMYLVWLVHELETAENASSSRFRWDKRVFGDITFNFNSFVKYDILEKPRPPPKERVCVVGECLVLMECGMKAAKDIRAGDVVRTSNVQSTRVVCTVTQEINAVIKICKIGKCYVTPEHPVRNVGCEWMIPCEEFECVEMYVEQINNFVLESGHCIVVDGIECITLGHMFSDPVVKHPIWGTEVICEFLKSFSTYPNVVIRNALRVEHLLQSIKPDQTSFAEMCLPSFS